jgi:hypothetical protein
MSPPLNALDLLVQLRATTAADQARWLSEALRRES